MQKGDESKSLLQKRKTHDGGREYHVILSFRPVEAQRVMAGNCSVGALSFTGMLLPSVQPVLFQQEACFRSVCILILKSETCSHRGSGNASKYSLGDSED